jgi:hypothetical protein
VLARNRILWVLKPKPQGGQGRGRGQGLSPTNHITWICSRGPASPVKMTFERLLACLLRGETETDCPSSKKQRQAAMGKHARRFLISDHCKHECRVTPTVWIFSARVYRLGGILFNALRALHISLSSLEIALQPFLNCALSNEQPSSREVWLDRRPQKSRDPPSAVPSIRSGRAYFNILNQAPGLCASAGRPRICKERAPNRDL